MPIIVPYIPENITVHLGAPGSSAKNVTVPFADYIKNVASSEVYPSWKEEALKANIYAQISYALNRVYVEYYPSRGYNFDITSDTAMDQKFINGRNVFANIDRLVNEIFNIYIRKRGRIEPLAAKYCNGTTMTCKGLSQWGSEDLAKQGKDAEEILKHYYGNDIELVDDAPIMDAPDSYPGTPLKLGSSGNNVKIVQTELNRISQNYPLINKISNVDGIFGTITESAVKTFQGIFNLAVDGIVGKATWYMLIRIYSGVTNLSELNSEGNKLFNVSLEYPDAITMGDTGEKVEILQYFLALLSDFYLTIPSVRITGIFEEQTRNAVMAFQQEFDLEETGVVDRVTWDEIYNAYKGILDTVFVKSEIFATDVEPYGGHVLKKGDTGTAVEYLQSYLTAISLQYPEVPPVYVTGMFGEETEESVLAYQKLVGLAETGTVGRSVWNSITNTYKDVVSSSSSRLNQNPGKTLTAGDSDSDNRKEASSDE